jgi:hypothetical protein
MKTRNSVSVTIPSWSASTSANAGGSSLVNPGRPGSSANEAELRTVTALADKAVAAAAIPRNVKKVFITLSPDAREAPGVAQGGNHLRSHLRDRS